jgi:CheY-like chemotaxis protein
MAPQMGNQKILIVDDVPDLLCIVVHALRGAGYQTVTASSGKAAVRELAAQSFDLVLTDLSMPEMSGVELIQHIRGDVQLKHLPIVVVTGFATGALATGAMEAGANSLLSKPFQRHQLLREVEKWLPPSAAVSDQPRQVA